MQSRYVQQGGVVEIYNDIPDSLREQLYTEQNQQLERRKKSLDSSIYRSLYHPVYFHLLS